MMNTLGNKARSLTEMQNLGLHVPAFFTLDTSYYSEFLRNEGIDLSPTTKIKILENLNSIGGTRWIVRSSSTKEDGTQHSFAGLFESYPDLTTPDQVYNAVLSCWKSACSERVQKYCERFHINSTHIKMAVIIQCYVEADVAGVLFTTHPTTGSDKEMLIEACRGAGERLVSGEVNPSRYRISWFGACSVLSGEENDKVYLSQPQLALLRQAGHKLQAHYGKPQDIEFVFKGSELFIVQCRPITKLQFGHELGEWTTADFRDGGVSSSVVSPLMWSLYSFVFSNSMAEYFQKIKLIDETEAKDISWFQVFYGRPYWNIKAVKEIMMSLPNFNERNFDQDLSVPATYPGDGRTTQTTLKGLWRALPVLRSLGREFEQQFKRSEQLLAKFPEIETRYRTLNLEALSDEAFAQQFKKLLNDQNYIETEYFKTIYNASNAKLEFMGTFKKYKRARPNLEYVHLISDLGASNATLPANELHDIATLFRSDMNIEALELLLNCGPSIQLADLQQLPADLAKALTEFIERYYYHSERELDLRVPRWSENCRFICATLKTLMTTENLPHYQELQLRKTEIYQSALQLLKEAHRDTWMNLIPGALQNCLQKLNRVRRFLWLREELRCLSTRMYFFIRRFAIELAHRKHIAVDPGSFSKSLVFYSAHTELLQLAQGKLPLDEFLPRAQQNMDYCHGFENFNNPNEIGHRYNGIMTQSLLNATLAATSEAPTLQGIGCSAGKIKATARVITDISQSARLKSGEILVTRFTDPGWTPLFSLASGVICETGGLLSHAALISREYGIPSVLNVKDATSSIKDGQEIEIDGTCGEVYLT
jgi:phosphohistidine swiveling domain-containing protein